jgi:lipopolysaccharide/colanic/teichoic acid biosynthesis glycosyltransferase
MVFGRLWLLWLAKTRGYEFTKRALDIFVALFALILFAPVMLALAIAIKLTDGGPVFYCQHRAGKWGKPFPCPKFRSMVVNADKVLEKLRKENHHGESITFKMKKDPRVTRIGKLMRRTSIDELPQIWCVLMGHMSLVGPRPAPPYEVSGYSIRQRRRLDVQPGITCIWQVSGRGDIPFDRQVEMDIDYIERRTIVTDLKLICLTVPAVVFARGAY